MALLTLCQDRISKDFRNLLTSDGARLTLTPSTKSALSIRITCRDLVLRLSTALLEEEQTHDRPTRPSKAPQSRPHQTADRRCLRLSASRGPSDPARCRQRGYERLLEPDRLQ